MNNIGILELLAEKKKILLEIEQLTDIMKDADMSRFEELLESRGELLERTVQANENIRMIAKNDELLKSVLNNTCDMSSLTDNMSEIYEVSMGCRAAVNRINKYDAQIRERIEAERDMYLGKIEALNSNSVSVAGSYRRAAETGFPQGSGDTNRSI
ncbi:MAG: hypothetical protein RR743_05290 [Oscillospiraceae bacterium]